MIRIVLVDDHAVVRSGYRRLIDAEPDLEVVGEAGSGEAAYALLAELRTDAIVLDLGLPGWSGVETLRRIIARDPGARVLVFSMHGNPALVEQALQAGARGYVTKHCDPAAMILALREVAAGRRYVAPELVAGRHDFATPDGRGTPLAALSPREFEILRMLVDGVALSEIADSLSLSPKTVANYQTLIRQKLRVANDVELLRLAARHGLIDLAGPDYRPV